MPPTVIVFDCDGVLLHSNELKSECFALALRETGCAEADIARFLDFQRANFGTSRQRLFVTFPSWELELRPVQDCDGLLALYADQLRGRYVTTPATPDMREVVSALRQPHIVSGSEQAELREVLAERGDAPLFGRILGSPTGKAEHLATLLAEMGAAPEAMLFVGHAEADLRAAAIAGCRFVYMDRFSTARARMRALQQEHGFPMIQNLRELPAALAAP